MANAQTHEKGSTERLRSRGEILRALHTDDDTPAFIYGDGRYYTSDAHVGGGSISIGEYADGDDEYDRLFWSKRTPYQIDLSHPDAWETALALVDMLNGRAQVLGALENALELIESFVTPNMESGWEAGYPELVSEISAALSAARGEVAQ